MAKDGEGFDGGGDSMAMLHELSRNQEIQYSTIKDETPINN
jgi:hypothetical protein